MSVVSVHALGDCALTLTLGQSVNPRLNAMVMDLANRIDSQRQQGQLSGVSDVVCAFGSLTLHFDPLAADSAALSEQLLQLANDLNDQSIGGTEWRLPLCIAPGFAPDLDRLLAHSGLTLHEIQLKLAALRLRVYMIGFMPGFAYMAEVPPELSLPRLESPRKQVPARSVAIAAQMCGIYPFESPGGWNLIGRTPVSLFDATMPEPSLLSAGDTVTWQLVSLEQYMALETQWQCGALNREALRVKAA